MYKTIGAVTKLLGSSSLTLRSECITVQSVFLSLTVPLLRTELGALLCCWSFQTPLDDLHLQYWMYTGIRWW